MLVLGIETSCDETGIALYQDKKGIISQELYSQTQLHADYGGVVPELASRDHIRELLPLLKKTLNNVQMSVSDIDGIAVTKGPGLAGALLVGNSIAYALAYALKIPITGINHLEGHLLAPMLSHPQLKFPFLALLVSGGHTQLIKANRLGDYQLLGDTLDDAAGEAFDKTAKILGLKYPGGASLARLAEEGDDTKYFLPRPMMDSECLNFSFSGLKTATLNLVNKSKTDKKTRSDIAASFEEAVVDVLCRKSKLALEKTNLNTLVVSGGVAANSKLRQRLETLTVPKDLSVFFPDVSLCTDNGAMIAFAGAKKLSRTQTLTEFRFDIRPRWEIAQDNLLL